MRVRLAAGLRHEIGNEMTALGLSRALLLTTREQSPQEATRAELGPMAVGVFGRATMHTPVEITNGALQAVYDALGLAGRDLDRAVDLAVKNSYWNPRPIERQAIRALLQNAWQGARPK